MESRPTSVPARYVSGDDKPESRHFSAPAGILPNVLEERSTVKGPGSENETTKFNSGSSTPPRKVESVVDARGNRSGDNLGQSGKTTTSVGGTANAEGRYVRSGSKSLRRGDSKSKWEILTNLETGTQYTIRPKKSEGYLAKKRSWPLKGWHKR